MKSTRKLYLRLLKLHRRATRIRNEITSIRSKLQARGLGEIKLKQQV